MRRILLLCLIFYGCLLVAAPSFAQMPMTGAGVPLAAAAGGGGTSISALTAGSSTCNVASCTVVSGQAFSAGVVVIGLTSSLSAGPVPATGVTINGVSATQVGSNITDSTTTVVQMWYAVVSAGTGNIVLSNGGTVGETCLSAWTVTGYSSSTPTANNSFNGLSSTQADPQGPMSSIVVASGGVAAFFIGATFHSATANPTTWVQSTRDAATETGLATGNGCAAAGSHISVANTYSGITASGSLSWLYAAMIGATWH